MNRNFKYYFSSDRKALYVILCIVLVLIFSLTVVYAALSTTLNINGQAEISSASWDIYLDNVQLNNQSATSSLPTISNKTTATFSTTLSKPGDFYEFSIDVVNNGSIDAMIDSVTKTPELSAAQKKYLNYIVEYQNGESITTKQLVEKKSFVRLKVKLEFRKDISASDLPTQSETLNLSFKVNYVQSDESGTNVKDNGVEKIKIISGDLETVGSEVAIGDEHFYIISSDEESVTLFAKYNLYVGYECADNSESSCTLYGEEATGRQDETMIGYTLSQLLKKGTIEFALTPPYWLDSNYNLKSEYGTEYPVYVYDSNSFTYSHVENYKMYLESLGVVVEEARLIKYEELLSLGCSSSDKNCSSAPSWVYSTSYWTGTVTINGDYVLSVYTYNKFVSGLIDYECPLGIRPVIKVEI